MQLRTFLAKIVANANKYAKPLRLLKGVRSHLFIGILSAVAGGLIVVFVSLQFQMSVQQQQINTIIRHSLEKTQRACNRFLTRLDDPMATNLGFYSYEFANISSMFQTMAFQAVYIDDLDQIVRALESLTALEAQYLLEQYSPRTKSLSAIKTEANAHCTKLDEIKELY